MRYGLTIFQPDNTMDTIFHYVSDLPFQNFNIGDFIDTRTFLNCDDELVNKMLKITQIHHVITELENGKVGRHQLRIFTTAVPNDENYLFPFPETEFFDG